MFGRPKRTVPKPEVVTSHQSENPMFHTQTTPELHQFRQRVLMAFGAVVILSVLALAIFGPWLEVTAVEVTGTRALNPDSVKAVTNTYLAGNSWLVLPRRNLWLLRKKDLASFLVQKISTKLSIEAVDISKHYPHQLLVHVTERTPVFLWNNGQDYATIDRQGVLIELRAQRDTTLDVVRDGLAAAIQPDQHVIIPDVAAKLLELQGALRRNHFTVSEYIIPTPTCPLPIPTPEEITSVNTNSTPSDQNANAEKIPTRNTNSNSNTSTEPPCDVVALRQKSQEIHVQLRDGALVLFDRHANLDAAVTTLARLLTQPENAQATYIDVRFEERVYIR